MSKYEYRLRDIKESKPIKSSTGKIFTRKAHKRHVIVRVDKKTIEHIKKGKARKLKQKKALEEYYSHDDFNLSRKKLIKLAKENGIDENDWEVFNDDGEWVKTNVAELEDYELTHFLRSEAGRRRVRKKFMNYTKNELYSFAEYRGHKHPHWNYKTKHSLIEFLSRNTDDYVIKQYEETRDNIKNHISNDQKYIIRLLSEKGSLSINEIKSLVGEDTFYKLQNDGYIHYKGTSKKYHHYGLTLYGGRQINGFEDLYKYVEIPNYKSMEKEFPHDIMQSIRALAKNRREYSIGLDFERGLKNPQQIVSVQGAESFTYHIGGDFEMFGHTHPGVKNPYPSRKDLITLKVGRPEFIVAGKTGKAIIMNVENDTWHRYWKETSYSSPTWNDISKKEDRDEYFRQTGVRIYPYRKGMKVKLLDDPKFEKAFPFFNEPDLAKIHASEIEKSELESIKKQSKESEKRIEEPKWDTDKKGSLGKWVEIKGKRKFIPKDQYKKWVNHYYMGPPATEKYGKLDKVKEKKNKQPRDPIGGRKGVGLFEKDQTVRWMNLTSDQLKKELNDINKYPDVKSIQIASESLLNRNEMNLKTREKVIKILVRKMGEEKAIASLGR